VPLRLWAELGWGTVSAQLTRLQVPAITPKS
jgi:hypothetical protein